MTVEGKLWWEAHFDEFLSDFETLIAIPSVSRKAEGNLTAPYGQPCVDVLKAVEAIAKRFGFDFFIDGNRYALLVWEGEKKETIGLFSHMDVVPAGPGWQYPPFELTALDDIYIGRGTGDNKGPALAVLYSLRYLKESGWKPKHTIWHFFGVNEECGMEDIDYFTERNPMPVFSLVPDSSFPVCFGEKGLVELDANRSLASDSLLQEWASGVASNSVPGLAEALVAVDYEKLSARINDPRIKVEPAEGGVKVTAQGKSAHAAFPEGSESAQNILAEALLDSGLFPDSDESFFKGLLSLFGDYYGEGIGVPFSDELSGKLTHVGGYSKLSGRVFQQNINIRYNLKADSDVVLENTKKALAEQGFSIVSCHVNKPMYVERSLPIIDKLTLIANEELGLNLEPYVMGGGTYARHLKNAVGYGPGGIPGDDSAFGTSRGHGHQPDEYISKTKLGAAFKVYVRAVPEVDSFFG